jgi:tetratricopeptide (TPR) repeat protein
MKFNLPRIIAILFTCFVSFNTYSQSDSLDLYIKRLRHSAATGGSETAFLSIGSDFMYGQEYLESGSYDGAERNFAAIVRSHNNHPYANYQLGFSMMKQNDPEKKKAAMVYFETAFKVIPQLKERFKRDFPSSTVINSDTQKNQDRINGDNPDTVKDKKEDGKKDNDRETDNNTGLENYINKIKESRLKGGPDTYMNSPGLDAFYGIEYYEKSEYRSSATNFYLSVYKDPSNPYVNYMLAVSLAAQGKNAEAKKYLDIAIAGDASLKNRFNNDASSAEARWNKSEAGKKIESKPATKIVYGGTLKMGKYTCHVTRWNGPNVSPAYRYDYEGYFELRKDGTYRWQDDGPVGKYKYNITTGEITWLSGYFKSAAPKSSLYQADKKVPQVTVKYTDNYKWECGCKN